MFPLVHMDYNLNTKLSKKNKYSIILINLSIYWKKYYNKNINKYKINIKINKKNK